MIMRPRNGNRLSAILLLLVTLTVSGLAAGCQTSSTFPSGSS